MGIATLVVSCYVDNLTSNASAKSCADRKRRASTSHWNLHPGKLGNCKSKASLTSTMGPAHWTPSTKTCHHKHWNAGKKKPAPKKPAKRTCSPAEVKGKEFYTWEARGRHCYHIIAGKVLEQDYKTKSATKCNKRGFRKTVTIGRGQGISSHYPNGDSTGCPGRKKRSAALIIKRVPGAKGTSRQFPSQALAITVLPSPQPI